MYRLREGMVLTQVCGAPLLVATRKLWEEKLPIRRIPKGVALAIPMLSKGVSLQGVVSFMTILSRTKNPKELSKNLSLELDKLCQEGYLIKIENQNFASG